MPEGEYDGLDWPPVVTAERVDEWLASRRFGVLSRPRPAAAARPTIALATSRLKPDPTIVHATPPQRSRGGHWRSQSVFAVAVLVLAVWASTGFYKVEADQVGVVLRFGRYGGTHRPGLNYHLPYPIESVLLPKVTEVNQLRIGNGAVTQMLTGDENIVEASAAVFWRIKDPVAFLFNVYDPEGTVRVAAEAAVRQVVGLNPIQAALSDQRQKIADDAQRLLQRHLDAYGTGIEVTQVELQRVDPPTAVIDAFNDVQRARADQERARNEAEAYSNDILPRARGDAEHVKQEAQAYREQVENQARGQAASFTALDGSYQQSRAITARRLYLDTMEQVLRFANKVMIDPSGRSASDIVPVLPLPLPPPRPTTTAALPTVTP